MKLNCDTQTKEKYLQKIIGLFILFLFSYGCFELAVRDNSEEPTGSCNIVSAAILLSGIGNIIHPLGVIIVTLGNEWIRQTKNMIFGAFVLSPIISIYNILSVVVYHVVNTDCKNFYFEKSPLMWTCIEINMILFYFFLMVSGIFGLLYSYSIRKERQDSRETIRN